MRRYVCSGIAAIIIFLVVPYNIFPQLSRDDVKEILSIQGTPDDIIEYQTNRLYEAYLNKTTYNNDEIPVAVLTSFSSGIMMGMHQSNTGLYKHTEWLPKFMRDWYGLPIKNDMVFSKSLSVQKVFRELDYIHNRMALENWDRYFGDKWYFIYPVHWLIKNISAELIKHKMKYGTFF